MNIGQRIKERRIALGMTADKLGEKLGKNRSTIYRYENGDIENMPLDILKPIAEALQTTPAWLMGWEQDQIDAVSEIESDANIYEDETEQIMHDFMNELSEMNFDPHEIDLIRKYMHAVNGQTSDELHNAYITLFVDMYKLDLTIEDLNEIYTYAQFIRSKHQ